MTSSMHAAIFLGNDSVENLHSVRNTDKKPTVQKLFDVTQKLIRKQNFGDLGCLTIKLENFCMGKAVLGERRRSNQAHENKSLCILKNSFYRCVGRADCSGSRTQNIAENWMESVESRWNSSE